MYIEKSRRVLSRTVGYDPLNSRTPVFVSKQKKLSAKHPDKTYECHLYSYSFEAFNFFLISTGTEIHFT